MAKAKAELPKPEAIHALIDGDGRLALRVTPNAQRDALSLEDGQLRARVSVVPEGGKANRAVIRLVAKALGVAPSRISLLRGETARDKVLLVEE